MNAHKLIETFSIERFEASYTVSGRPRMNLTDILDDLESFYGPQLPSWPVDTPHAFQKRLKTCESHDIPSPEASINRDAAPLSNQYRLIRADGTATTFPGKVSID